MGGAGAAYVFRREDGTWSQQSYLKASDAWINCFFGSGTAVDGDTLAIVAVERFGEGDVYIHR